MQPSLLPSPPPTRRPTRTKPWSDVVRDALASGTVASVASTAMLAIAGRRELTDSAAPLNGPSQWLWGTPAARRNGFSVRHTVCGYAIHHLASIFWAVVYERLRPSRHSVAAALSVAAVANIVDFRLTPERFTPGFERRLSKASLLCVYVTFALGLAAASALTSR